MTVQINLST